MIKQKYIRISSALVVIDTVRVSSVRYGPVHNKTYNETFETSKDSDQLVHLPQSDQSLR